MRVFKLILFLVLLSISSSAFANHGIDMAAMLVWFYVGIITIFWGIVLRLLHHKQYKHLWVLIISLFFSMAAMALMLGISSLVKSEWLLETDEKFFLIASVVGLIIIALILVWTFFLSIEQYKQLNSREK